LVVVALVVVRCAVCSMFYCEFLSGFLLSEMKHNSPAFKKCELIGNAVFQEEWNQDCSNSGRANKIN
jgi:hypothetical protein